jgi:hypothetical protein
MNIAQLDAILCHASNEEPWHSECGYIYAPRNEQDGDDGKFRCVGEVAEADAEAITAIHNHACALVECARLLMAARTEIEYWSSAENKMLRERINLAIKSLEDIK